MLGDKLLVLVDLPGIAIFPALVLSNSLLVCGYQFSSMIELAPGLDAGFQSFGGLFFCPRKLFSYSRSLFLKGPYLFMNLIGLSCEPGHFRINALHAGIHLLHTFPCKVDVK